MKLFKFALLLFCRFFAAMRFSGEDLMKVAVADNYAQNLDGLQNGSSMEPSEQAFTISIAISFHMFNQLLKRELPFLLQALGVDSHTLQTDRAEFHVDTKNGDPANSVSFHISNIFTNMPSVGEVEIDIHMTWALIGSFIKLNHFQIKPRTERASMQDRMREMLVNTANAVLGPALDVAEFLGGVKGVGRKYRSEFCVCLSEEDAQSQALTEGKFAGSVVGLSADEHGTITVVVKLRRGSSSAPLSLVANESMPFSPGLFLGGQKAQALMPYYNFETTWQKWTPNIPELFSPREQKSVDALSRVGIWMEAGKVMRSLPLESQARKVLEALFKVLQAGSPIDTVPSKQAAWAINTALEVTGIVPTAKLQDFGITFIKNGVPSTTLDQMASDYLLSSGGRIDALSLGANLYTEWSKARREEWSMIQDLIGEQVHGIYMILDFTNAGAGFLNSIFDSASLQALFRPDAQNGSLPLDFIPAKPSLFRRGHCTAE